MTEPPAAQASPGFYFFKEGGSIGDRFCSEGLSLFCSSSYKLAQPLLSTPVLTDSESMVALRTVCAMLTMHMHINAFLRQIATTDHAY